MPGSLIFDVRIVEQIVDRLMCCYDGSDRLATMCLIEPPHIHLHHRFIDSSRVDRHMLSILRFCAHSSLTPCYDLSFDA